MQFQISTPQTVRECVARQESRRASKRKSVYGSATEHTIKKQSLLHFSLPPAPAPAPAQPQAHVTTCSRPTGERPKLVDASLPPAQAQTLDMTNLGPSSKKRKNNDHHSVTPAQRRDMVNHGLATQEPELDHNSMPPAQAHDVTDLEPATKKQRLSYASLPPTRSRVRMSSEESTRFYGELYRRRLRGWCKSQGFDYGLLDQSIIPDTLLLSPSFDLYKYMESQSTISHSDGSGPSTLDVSQFVNLSAEKLMADGPISGAHCAPKKKHSGLSHQSPALDTSAQACPVSDEVSVHHPLAQGSISRRCPGSGDEISHSPLVQDMTTISSPGFDGKIIEASQLLVDQTPASLSTNNPSHEGPICSSSDPNAGYNARSTSSDQTASVGSDCTRGNDSGAASSDQIAPLSLDANLRDDTTPAAPASSEQIALVRSIHDVGDDTIDASSDQVPPSSLDANLRADTTPASSSRTPSVGPALDKGGRPRGRKPRTPRTPKGPTRFQKNRPVKATVNMDVWENILVFCPLDFLLKARSISMTFRSVLKDDSFVWKRARLNQFGPAMPDPPLGLSEPQYADLVTGTGCQTRGCTSRKTRKTYWTLGKRLCVGCFQESFLPVSVLNLTVKLSQLMRLTCS